MMASPKICQSIDGGWISFAKIIVAFGLNFTEWHVIYNSVIAMFHHFKVIVQADKLWSCQVIGQNFGIKTNYY